MFGPSAVATTIEEHQRLIDSLESVGIEVVLNDVAFCGEEPVDGAYFPINSVLVVCQDYSSSISSKEVEWTPNDLDTLRHEAHHVVQDCLKGVLGDRESSLLFDEKGEFNSFVINALTDKQIENIIESYRERGADDETIVMELEAFAVARSVSPDTIADAMDNLCRI